MGRERAGLRKLFGDWISTAPSKEKVSEPEESSHQFSSRASAAKLRFRSATAVVECCRAGRLPSPKR